MIYCSFLSCQITEYNIKISFLKQHGRCRGGGGSYTGTYCPLVFVVLASAFKAHSFFALVAGIALKNDLCTPCGDDT